MKILSHLLLIVTLMLAVFVTGCGKKADQANKIDPGPPTTKQGFGALSGTCSVCGKKSENLLAVTAMNGGYTATVCGQACGDKFRAVPAQYGTRKTN